ncbi:MAG: RNA-binding S4 domain-containing protein [Methylococcaceae bacterium]
MASSELETLRLDKWLWAARFYKTRKLAAEAVDGGKVHVNKQRAKPSKEIRPGTELSISKDSYRWEITIIALSSQRRPAKEAVLFYEESPESHAKRQQQIQLEREQKVLFAGIDESHRPNKKERRLIHRFKEG